ncbi:tyrosine-type recombinase/integrase [Methanolobus profundi]|nr:site-specific integrase [Methanolobus profundi]
MVQMDLINEFVRDCELRGLELRTVQTYRGSVRRFLDEYPDPTKCTKHEILDYLGHLQTKDITVGTIKRDFAAISGLFDYLLFCEKIRVNPVGQIRKRYLNQPEMPESRQIPELSEMRQLIGSIEPESVLERTIVTFLAKTAGRKGEFLALKKDDVDLRKDMIYWPSKKKRKIRIGFVDQELHDLLEEYLIWREEQKPKSEYLWISTTGHRIHKDYVNAVIQYYAKPLGMHDHHGPLHTRLTSHCLRGFFTTQMQRAGMQEVYIKWLRGDSLKKKTWANNYLEFDPELVRKEYLSCVPELIM